MTLRWLPLAALLCLAGTLGAEESARDGPVRVSWQPGEEDLGALVLRNARSTAAEVSARLGVGLDAPFTITLLPEEHYRRWVPGARGEWSAAVAWPARARVLINTSRVDLRNNVYETLKHELVHLALGRVEVRRREALPLWFHEGVAQWVVGSLFQGSRDELSVAAAGGHLVPLSTLRDRFPPGAEDAALAYAESYDAILLLEERHGPEAVRRVISGFGRGLPFDEALARVAGPGFEESWRLHASKGPPFWLAYLSHNPWMVFALLMGLGAAVLVAGYVRYRRRRAAVLRRWEEEEEEA